MTGAVLLELENNRAEADLRTFQEWRAIDQEDLRVEAAERAVRVATNAPREATQVWASVWKRAEENRIEDYQATGEGLKRLFARLTRAVEVAQELADAVIRQGRAVDGADQLPEALAVLRKMERRALDAWPWISDGDVNEAMAQCERGQSKTPEEILRELQGGRP